MNFSQLILSKEQLNTLFPFFITINKEGIIETIGNSQKKLFGDITKQFFHEVFTLVRPQITSFDFTNLLSCTEQFILLESKQGITLNGQFIYLKTDEIILFIGSPWFSSIEKVLENNLTLNDYALHNPIIDLLQLVKTHEIVTIDLKNTLQNLQEQKKILERLSLIVQETNDGVIMMNNKGEIEWVNAAFEKNSEYILTEVKGKRLDYILEGQETDPNTSQYLKDRILNAEMFDCEILNYTKTGNKVWFRLKGQPIFDHEGKVTQIFALQENISLRKKSESLIAKAETEIRNNLTKATELNVLKDKFIRVISHELRTPLAAIQSSVELIEKKLRKTNQENYPTIERHFTIVYTEIERLAMMMKNLLFLSYEKEIKLNIVKTDIEKYINELIQNSFFQFNLTKRFEVVSKGKKQLVEIDQKLFWHVIANLLSNAIKYSDPDKKIIIQIQFTNKEVLISVKDFGMGIPESEQQYLFNTFYRATNIENIDGNGLGLVIIKNMIDIHNGSINFNSRVNQGTEFTISLPVYYKKNKVQKHH
ncbi:MAG: PAS domain-containing protein [Bacteroidota bacterium]|nr:PAS domain-containing protein [Bacteroidota bacterium]